VYENTPIKTAGIQEGDLIVAIGPHRIESKKSFRKHVAQTPPGDLIDVTIYRDGELAVLPVTVGKETYEKWGYFNVGFRLESEIDPIPRPGFNLLGIISYEKNNTRLELNSPEYRYYRQSLPLLRDQSDRLPDSDADFEGWDMWFVIFGFSGKNIILSQES
jgi:hypothetical protein